MLCRTGTKTLIEHNNFVTHTINMVQTNAKSREKALAHLKRAQHLLGFGTGNGPNSLKRKRIIMLEQPTVTFTWYPLRRANGDLSVCTVLKVGITKYTPDGNRHRFVGQVLECSGRTPDGDGLDVHFTEQLIGRHVLVTGRVLVTGSPYYWMIEIPGAEPAETIRGHINPDADVSVEDLAATSSSLPA